MMGMENSFFLDIGNTVSSYQMEIIRSIRVIRTWTILGPKFLIVSELTEGSSVFSAWKTRTCLGRYESKLPHAR
jgi:hypothetical protein